VRENKPRNVPDFTLRQIVILLTVYLEPPPHTVRSLARKLGVSKPVITRALDTMSKHTLVARARDKTDRRSVNIQRTLRGALYVNRLGDMIVTQAGRLGEP
jgi:DNA-binding MarR family transcriptional regulator